jgi:hypothetical protein
MRRQRGRRPPERSTRHSSGRGTHPPNQPRTYGRLRRRSLCIGEDRPRTRRGDIGPLTDRAIGLVGDGRSCLSACKSSVAAQRVNAADAGTGAVERPTHGRGAGRPDAGHARRVEGPATPSGPTRRETQVSPRFGQNSGSMAARIEPVRAAAMSHFWLCSVQLSLICDRSPGFFKRPAEQQARIFPLKI